MEFYHKYFYPMNKCPQCLNTLGEGVEVCSVCDFSIAADVVETLAMFGVDETRATKILSDKKMTPEKWRKIKGLFEAAQEVSPEKRERFLKSVCGADEELRAEIEKLLGSFDVAGSFLEKPVVAEAASLFEDKETVAMKQTTGEFGSGGFVAGTVLEGRYRIIGLLGKGGMGEVYKAEDLKLNQTVALKFLPEKLEKNEDALKRFIGEVRTARQVSHANVCKVFDIGETGGKHFLSMEFLDGDDLSSLLRRIGRLPSDKASEISRQICFGLHAIHDAGILHRDLKPANIIIDSKGKARITDFGIAGLAADISKEEIRVGTPAYMSPEQITGEEVTARSDIYSLGLLLYEIFTGKQAMQADSCEELLEKQKTTQPTNPSTFVENIDPIVEKTINRCLEKNPKDRPESALQVALAMPGGNPLEAAIAAGETPSPEMVAAAPKKGVLKPLVAVGFLLAFLTAYFGIIAYNQTYKTYTLTPFEKSPEVLAEKSRQIINKFGYAETPTDAEYEFVQDNSFLNGRDIFRFKENKYGLSNREMIRAGQPFNVYFLYRQSPEYLEPADSVSVTENEPPLDKPNMANVKLDVRGRLFEFVAVPKDVAAETETEIDWSKVFAEAGLDLSKFKQTESKFTPPVFADKRAAWTGTLADFGEIPIHIETAEIGGKPVYFKVFAPWNLDANAAAINETGTRKIGTIIIILWIFIAIIGSLFLAYRNLKAGRGDLRGGLKLTFLLFVVALLSQIIIADHVPTVWGELSIIYEAVSYASVLGICVGILYIALEPFVRRSWSEMLISWNRIMKGEFRDPMVGRDVLIGGLMGVGHGFGIAVGTFLVQLYFGKFDAVSDAFDIRGINGTAAWTSEFLLNIVGSIVQSLIFLFLAYLFYRSTKKKLLGVLVVGFLFFFIQFLFFVLTVHWILIISALINAACLVIAMWRFGLLGLISYWFYFEATYLYTITFDSSVFFFPTSTLAVIVSLGIIFYAFHISLAGQPIFGGNVLKEIED